VTISWPCVELLPWWLPYQTADRCNTGHPLGEWQRWIHPLPLSPSVSPPRLSTPLPMQSHDVFTHYKSAYNAISTCGQWGHDFNFSSKCSLTYFDPEIHNKFGTRAKAQESTKTKENNFWTTCTLSFDSNSENLVIWKFLFLQNKIGRTKI